MSELIPGRWSSRLSPAGQYLLAMALRALALLAALMTVSFYLASGALADDDVVANSISTVQVVSILVGTLIPIVVSLVTRLDWSATAKALTNLLLSAISGFGFEFINNSDHFAWQQALLTTIVTFVVSVATYLGLWKPSGADARIHAATG